MRYICSKTRDGAVAATLTFGDRSWPEGVLRPVAQQEHLFINNMVEALIRYYCGHTGITIQNHQAAPLDDERKQ